MECLIIQTNQTLCQTTENETGLKGFSKEQAFFFLSIPTR
jgi:hypothetical protein